MAQTMVIAHQGVRLKHQLVLPPNCGLSVHDLKLVFSSRRNSLWLLQPF
jgi:hypothetical protein